MSNPMQYAAILSVVMLIGCGSSGGNDKSLPPGDALISSIWVEGTTSEYVTATVNGISDNDGMNDAAFSVQFNLDGGASANSLPVDIGGDLIAESFDFTIHVVDVAAHTGGKTISVTVIPP